MSDIKTKFKNAITVVSADFANSIYGGLSGSTEGQFLPDDDPRISGHIHDGQNKDGHAGKIDLVEHVKGQLRNTNLADNAVTKRNVNSVLDQQFAIPESEIVNGQTRYYLDLSDIRSDLLDLSNATPQPLGVASAGVSLDVSRDDHVHEMPSLDDLTDVNAPSPNNGDVLTYSVLTSEWVPGPSTSVSLSSAIPQPLGVASAGVGTSASRDDHIHAMPALDDLTDVNAPSPNDGDVLTYSVLTSDWVSAAPTVITLSNTTPQPLGVASAGVGTSASRDDHIHAAPALNDLSNVSVATPNDLDVLTYDNATSTWIAAAASGGSGWPTSTGTDINLRAYEQALVATANTSLIITPTGTGALQAHIADNAATGGNARGTRAVDWQQERNAATQVASGTNAVIGGGRRNTASSNYATVGGGSQNTASGEYATVAGGEGNTASGLRSTVGGGLSNTASTIYTTVAGGQGNTASGNYNTVGGGYINTTSSQTTTVGGGQENTASGWYATVAGGLYGLANQYGMFSHASGRFSNTGDAQYSRMILRRQTTDATPLVLTADGTSGGADDRVALIANSVYMFEIHIAARQNTTADSAWWKITGGIKRDGSNNTSLIGSNTTITQADLGAAAWTVQVTADDLNEALQIEVTGELNKTIRWVATVHLTRVAG